MKADFIIRAALQSDAVELKNQTYTWCPPCALAFLSKMNLLL